jgi:NIMA (never in mitosis gene a)-related kinase 1/4/5
LQGTLHDYLTKQGEQGLPEDAVWRLLIQVTIALQHMHSQNVLHRDIKSMNIFLGKEGIVKLGDLGVAKVLSTQTSFAKTVVGTPYYLSPELCSGKAYNDRSDIWALGIVLYECCTGQHPFDADNQGALIMRILRGEYAPISSTAYSSELRDVVKQCLNLDSKARPSSEVILGLAAVKATELKIAIPDTSVVRTLPGKQELPCSCLPQHTCFGMYVTHHVRQGQYLE